MTEKRPQNPYDAARERMRRQDREAVTRYGRPLGPFLAGGGSSRLERATALAAALSALGGDVRLDVVPGVRHDVNGVMNAVRAFLGEASTRRS